MSSSTWQDHFKEQLVGLEPPREGSFLEMALTEGRITEEAYLKWASETHLIPLVSSQFFTEISPDPALLEKASLPWRSTFFPVAEWDGHLIVAGLERPSQLPSTCSFVLAPRESLSLWWEKLAEHSQPLEGPDGIDLNLSSENELDLPLDAAAPAPTLSFAGVSVIAATEPTSEEAPAVAAAPTPAPIPETPVVKETSSPEIAIEPMEQTQTRTFISLEVSPIPAAPKQALVLKNNPTLEKHSLSSVFIETPSHKTDIQKSLTSLAGAYPQLMFLVFDESRSGLIPLLWSESFKAPPTLQKIHLGTASIFEIVSSTEKPFHGPVVPNDINTQFLTSWNGGAQPETMTIIPLLGTGQLCGMILGIGPQSSYTMAILRFAEKAGNDLMKTWKITNPNAA